MFGSNILEISIGVMFVFLLVSIICTSIRELLESWLKTRAAYLEHGIREILQDKSGNGLAKSFYNHPLIYSLFTGEYKSGKETGNPDLFAKGANLPSYIPSKNFAKALMDIAARGPETDEVSSDPNSPIISLESIRLNIANIRNPAVQRVLLSAIDTAQGDLNKVQANIEEWYNSGMDRVSGWYKRSTQFIIFGIGLIVAVALNINIITIADYLSRNETARRLLVEKVGTLAKDSLVTTQNFNDAKADLDKLGLPIGWKMNLEAPRQNDDTKANDPWNDFFAPVLGWLIVAFASTLGAPFWFDMLNKFMVIRSTVKPHEKSQEEASEDRQLTPKPQPQADGVQSGQKINISGGMINNVRALQPIFPPTPSDATSDIDSCDVVAAVLTMDENLPVTEGGVV